MALETIRNSIGSTPVVTSTAKPAAQPKRDIGAEIIASLQSGDTNKTKSLIAERDVVYNQKKASDTTGKYNDLRTTDQIISDAGYSPEFFRGTLPGVQSSGNYVAQPQVKDNSEQIKQMFEQEKAAAVAKLKEAIAKSKGNYQQTIANAPQMFQGAKNQSEVDRFRSLNTVREQLANSNDRGGTGRQDLTNVETVSGSRMNNIMLQQQNVISEAQKAINELEASGNFEEAQIIANNANERLRALIEESNRVETVGYNRLRDSIGDQRYNQEYSDSRSDVLYNREYQQGRDTVEDQRYTDELEWSRNQNNPAVRAQILNNQARELEIELMKDPNSYENQKKRLDLEGIRQDLATGKITQDIARQEYNNLKAGLTKSGGKPSGTATKYDDKQNFTADDYAKYIEDVYYSPEQIGVDDNGIPKYSSKKVVTAQGKRDIAAYLANLYKNGVPSSIVNALAAKYNIE